MNEPEPQKTYALIVGIEKYHYTKKSGLKKLKGPASDALRFAEWLLEREVPSDNILLHISESDSPELLENKNDKLSSLWKNKKEANHDKIYKAICHILPDKEGDLLYVFWGGHGTTLLDKKERTLFFDDGELRLNLDSLLEHLKSDTFKDKFNKQILIIDACANYKNYKYDNSLPSPQELPKGKTLCGGIEQFTILATKEGYGAKNNDTEETGRLSKALLEELAKKEALLFPDKEMEEIVEKIREKVEAETQGKQTPIYLWVRVQDGSEKCMPLNEAGEKYIILNKEWKSLITILSKIDGHILYISCYFVLEEVGKNKNNNKDTDIEGNFPEIAALKSIHTDSTEILEILNKVLDRMVKEGFANEREDPILITLKLVYYLLNLLESSELVHHQLTDWKNKITNEVQKKGISLQDTKKQVDQYLNELYNKYQQSNPYLMIVCKKSFSSAEHYELSAELIFEQDNLIFEQDNYDNPKRKHEIAHEVKVECENIPVIECENIQKVLNSFLSLTLKIIKIYRLKNKESTEVKNNELTVEIFLENNQLILPSEQSYEKIEIEVDLQGNEEWISCKYRFALRSLSRLYEINAGNVDRQKLKSKWRKLLFDKEKKINSLFDLFDRVNLLDNESKNDQNDDGLKNDENLIGVILFGSSKIFKQKEDGIPKIEKWFQKQIINKKMHIFIWVICDEVEERLPNNKDYEESLLKEINFISLENLLDDIKQKRHHCFEKGKSKSDLVGYHLGFLCDNPYRLPSEYEVIGGDVFTSFW